MDLSPLFENLFRSVGDGLGVHPLDVETAFWTILVGIFCNVACAIVGCYLVLQKISLLGDAISHAVLPGLAVAFLLSGTLASAPMFLGALGFGVLTAFLTHALKRYGNVPEDAGMGVVFTSLFAVGVILMRRNADRIHLDADCVLYGLIEFTAFDSFPLWGIEVPRTLQLLAPVLCLTMLFVGFFWKELKISSFDPTLATAMGFNATLVHYLLMGMVALVTVASFEAVGSILVVAMLIVPGATAHLLTDRLGHMMIWSVVVAVVSAVGGYLLAVWIDTSVAGMMAVTAGLQFAVAVFLAPRHGIISKAFNNFRLALRIVSEDIVAMLYRLEESRSKTAKASSSESFVPATWKEAVTGGGGGWIAWMALPILCWKREIYLMSGGKLRLTDLGREQAQSLIRSHRLWETYLDEHFELPADHLHEPASRIEHYIGPALQDRLARELDRPNVDPHGTAIPPSQKGNSSQNDSKQE